MGGPTEGRNDELLLVLLHKSAGAIAGTASSQEVEVLSIAGAPALVATDTFDVPVLRGRRGTVGIAFSAGSFPDSWTNYEGWVIPRYSLEPLSHTDFATMISSGATGYFRIGAAAGGTQYAPDLAYAERERRTDASLDLAEYSAQPDATTWVPELTTRIPSGLKPVVGAATGVTVSNSTNGLTATNTQGAIDELAARPQQPTGGTIGQPLLRTEGGSIWADLAITRVSGLSDALNGLQAGKQDVMSNAAALANISEGGDGSMLWKGVPVGAVSVVLLLGVSVLFSTNGGALAGGEISTFDTGWGWVADGYAVPIPYTACFDDYSGISDGPITSWATGTGWAGPGYAVT